MSSIKSFDKAQINGPRPVVIAIRAEAPVEATVVGNESSIANRTLYSRFSSVPVALGNLVSTGRQVIGSLTCMRNGCVGRAVILAIAEVDSLLSELRSSRR